MIVAASTLLMLSLVELHTPDGQIVEINPDEITSIRSRGEGEHFTKEAHCLINMSDGKYVTVAETCDKVMKLIREMK